MEKDWEHAAREPVNEAIVHLVISVGQVCISASALEWALTHLTGVISGWEDAEFAGVLRKAGQPLKEHQKLVPRLQGFGLGPDPGRLAADAERLLGQRHRVVHSVMLAEVRAVSTGVYEAWHARTDAIWPVAARDLGPWQVTLRCAQLRRPASLRPGRTVPRATAGRICPHCTGKGANPEWRADFCLNLRRCKIHCRSTVVRGVIRRFPGADMAYVSWVSSGTGEQIATAAQVVLAVAPADDAGAETADRYDWQAAMAAADGLALYHDALGEGSLPADADAWIVCEHHEDWVVIRGDDAELVSGKHREPGYSVFTTATQLAGDGGLAHMFGRWHTLGERPSCRLVTTAGLAPGPAQGLEKAAAHLRDVRLAGQDLLPGGDHEPAISGFMRALQQYPGDLPSSWQATTGDRAQAARDQAGQVCRFLAGLCIEHGKPSRAHVGHAAPTMYCAPVLDRLGHADPALAVAVWEAVHGLFRARMRAAGPVPRGALPAVLAYQPGTLPPGTAGERALAARIVTLADIEVAVRAALAHPRGFLPLPPARRVTRLAVKMAAGCCTDNSIERAEQLRLDYQRYWRARVSGDPAARASQQRLRRELLRISDQATAALSAGPGAAWGADLWRELQARVEAMPGGWPEDLDPGLRLGGICDLSNRCQVWFSDRFDVDGAIAQQAVTP